MLNLLHLRSFLAVVESGSFHDASRALGCSQPTVSQHVLKLEADLDARLLMRDRQRCQPTAAGMAFIPFARSLLSLEERGRGAVSGRVLTIGASGNVGIYLLQPHLRSFRGSFGSELRIDVWIGTNPEVADRLVGRELDVAIMEWWDDRSGVAANHWRSEPLVVIVAPDHVWAARSAVTRNELLRTPLIGGESGSGTGRLLRAALGEAAADMQVAFKLGSTEAVKHAVKAGLGVSIVMASAVRDEVEAGTLCALAVEGAQLSKDIYVMRHADDAATAPGSRFVDHLLAETPQA